MNPAVDRLQQARIAKTLKAQDGNVGWSSWINKAKKSPNSRALAINAMCEQCMGGAKEPGLRNTIRECTSKECPLHQFRPYK